MTRSYDSSNNNAFTIIDVRTTRECGCHFNVSALWFGYFLYTSQHYEPSRLTKSAVSLLRSRETVEM